ncbi:hypothetical protein [Desulfovibrio inopinatus]|uniref:hypothetical protein n=1 Tax=Desulfovibrio inopinatus TaxID=102109 RepID=UPI0012EC4835|nr:hypothetical protein [Desulfovibrio inopinatus]
MKYPSLCRCVILPVLMLGIVLVSPAHAHKVRVFAYMEGNDVIAETAFSGGSPAKGAHIIAFDAATDAELAAGETNSDGIWRFPLPESAQNATKGIRIVLNVGEGHRGEWLLEPSEYLTTSVSPSDTAVPVPQTTATPSTPAPAASIASNGTTLDEAELTRVLGSLLDQKLSPIKRQLLQLEDPGPSFKDIVGGIGFLVGIAGIVAYLRSRKK